MTRIVIGAALAAFTFGAASAQACSYDMTAEAEIASPMILAQAGGGGGAGGDTGSKAGVSGPTSSSGDASVSKSPAMPGSTGSDINRPAVSTMGPGSPSSGGAMMGTTTGTSSGVEGRGSTTGIAGGLMGTTMSPAAPGSSSMTTSPEPGTPDPKKPGR